ncbi:MAG TPA: hypothetical protein DDW49_11545 [Deltaproteobacteria bacterium]|nr:MAG: hypothetical protein A2048_05765 [Deltaproteobacteria bacterium GWA2_45_12]HBF14001.1 hypothetical protein [Deltaproteobacteria bacterium]
MSAINSVGLFCAETPGRGRGGVYWMPDEDTGTGGTEGNPVPEASVDPEAGRADAAFTPADANMSLDGSVVVADGSGGNGGTGGLGGTGGIGGAGGVAGSGGTGGTIVDGGSSDGSPDGANPPPVPLVQTHVAVALSSYEPGSNAVTKFWNLTEGRFENVPDVLTHQDTALSSCGDDVFVVSRGDGRVLAYNKADLSQPLWTRQFAPTSNPQGVACDDQGRAVISFYNPDPMEAEMIGRRDVVFVDRDTGEDMGGIDLSPDSPVNPRVSAVGCREDQCYTALQHQDDNFQVVQPGTLRNVDDNALSVELEGSNPARMDSHGASFVIAQTGNFNDDAGGVEMIDPVALLGGFLPADAFDAFAPGLVAVSGDDAFVGSGFPTVVARVPLSAAEDGVLEVLQVYASGAFASDLTTVHAQEVDHVLITERNDLATWAVVEVDPQGGEGHVLIDTRPQMMEGGLPPAAVVGF